MRKYFFAGLVIFLPIALTIVVIIFLFDFFTTPFVPLVQQLVDRLQPYLPVIISHDLHTFLARLLALVMMIISVFLLGFVTRWFLIRHPLKWLNALMERIPFMKTVFKVTRDVSAALFAEGKGKAFQRPVLVPFPYPPSYSIAFISGEVPEECQRNVTTPLVPVFAPTAPHPISGFLFLVSKDLVREVNMTNEDAVKFLVSCGVIIPSKEGKSL